MKDITFVHRHLLNSLCAAVAEANGFIDVARRLRSQTKLRLMSMSDTDIQTLAGVTANHPERPVDQVYNDIQEAIALHQTTAHQWLSEISDVVYFPVDSNLPDMIPSLEEMAEIEQISTHQDP